MNLFRSTYIVYIARVCLMFYNSIVVTLLSPRDQRNLRENLLICPKIGKVDCSKYAKFFPYWFKFAPDCVALRFLLIYPLY
jgi:hypothetical protein